jgi:hypothetical protein
VYLVSGAINMKQLFLLFSHTLTDEQKTDATNTLHVKKFVSLPPDLQRQWSNIPENLKEIQDYLKPIKNYIKSYAKQSDYVLIQGDFGAVYDMINFSKSIGLIPLHSTTKRETQEQIIDNTVKKISTFRHVLYRRY